MGQRGPVSLAELVDRSVGIAGEIVELLESDPAEVAAVDRGRHRSRQGAADHTGKPPDRRRATPLRPR